MTDVFCTHKTCEHNYAGKCKAKRIYINRECRSYVFLDIEKMMRQNKPVVLEVDKHG